MNYLNIMLLYLQMWIYKSIYAGKFITNKYPIYHVGLIHKKVVQNLLCIIIKVVSVIFLPTYFTCLLLLCNVICLGKILIICILVFICTGSFRLDNIMR